MILFMHRNDFFLFFSFQLMAEERGLIVDIDGYNAAMEEARQKARSARNKVLFEEHMIRLHNHHVVSWLHTRVHW